MIINKYIVHLLDKEADAPVLNDCDGRINPEIDNFLRKAINKANKNDKTKKLQFKNYTKNSIKSLADDCIYNSNNFIENSKEIASYLFDCIKDKNLASCDLIFILFTVKDEQKIAILNLEFKSQYTHSIDFIDDKFNINIIENNNILSNTRINNAAIINLSGLNDEYHLKGYGTDTFINDFLESEEIYDDTYNTKMFNVVTDHILKNYTTDVKACIDTIAYKDYILKEKDVIDTNEFIENISNIDANIVVTTALKQELDRHNINQKFEIDKKYIEKQLKNKNLKTDTGFNIKAKSNDIDDPMKFSVTQNTDGSYNIVIKNIRNIK